MNIYAVDKLMSETRRVAAEYYLLTGQILPISSELARYDLMQLLDFTPMPIAERGVDLIATEKWSNLKVQVKSKTLCKPNNNNRLGSFNLTGFWEAIVLVIFDKSYQPHHIYLCCRDNLINAIDKPQNVTTKHKSRGMISIAKFKAISELIWKNDK